MSLEVVRQVLVRAATDPEFRKLFFEDRARALESFDLTDEERASLSEIEDEDRLAVIYQEAETKSGFRLHDTRI